VGRGLRDQFATLAIRTLHSARCILSFGFCFSVLASGSWLLASSLMRSISHISDLHFGRLDAPVAEALVEDLRRHPATLLVVSGDFTQRARAGQYAEAAAYLKRLPTPQLVVPGNHDVPMYNVIRRFFFPLNRYFKHITQDLTPVFQDDELFVLGVNTARSFTQKAGGSARPNWKKFAGECRLLPPAR
jgi:hypothetical protein